METAQRHGTSPRTPLTSPVGRHIGPLGRTEHKARHRRTYGRHTRRRTSQRHGIPPRETDGLRTAYEHNHGARQALPRQRTDTRETDRQTATEHNTAYGRASFSSHSILKKHHNRQWATPTNRPEQMPDLHPARSTATPHRCSFGHWKSPPPPIKSAKHKRITKKSGV